MSLVEHLGLGLEVLEVSVVCVHGNWVLGALQQVAPLLKGGLNCQEFLIVDVVIALGGVECTGVESTGVQLAVGVDLRQHAPNGETGGIGLHNEGFRLVRMDQDRLGSEGVFQPFECLLGLSVPLKLDVFLSELG